MKIPKQGNEIVHKVTSLSVIVENGHGMFFKEMLVLACKSKEANDGLEEVTVLAKKVPWDHVEVVSQILKGNLYHLQ